MTVTYGFYDSLAGDRKYNAEQMSRIFEGIIADGIFASIGGAFAVTQATGMSVQVAAGRAWFSYTWTLNDSAFIANVLASEPALPRIDTVVIEVNKDLAVRANSIKVIKGTPNASPVAPTLANTATLKQYPLADLYIAAGVTSIITANITNRIGSVATPFVTSPVPQFNFGPFLANWEASFSTWFNNLVNQLSGSQVTNLQNQIDVLTANITKVDNYIITPSAPSNILTVSIKTLAGTDATAGNPIRFKIGDTVYSLTAGASIVKAASTNWMNMGSLELAGRPVDLFVYAIAESGASAGLKFGLSRHPYSKYMGDFINTNTDEKYIAGNWTNFVSTDPVLNIGRIRAQLSGTPNFLWSIPSPYVVNRPIYESDWLTWLPQYTGFSVVPTGNDYYKVNGDTVLIHRDAGTNGTSNLTTFTMTYPFKFVTSSAAGGLINVWDNNAASSTIGHMQTTAGSNLVSLYKSFFQGVWTNTGAKNAYAPDFIYKIR